MGAVHAAAATRRHSPLPTATWAAFRRVLEVYRRDGVPAAIKASDLSTSSADRQVVQSLQALGFVGAGGVPQLGLHRLVSKNVGVVQALEELAPDVIRAIRAERPAPEVAQAFAGVFASSDSVSRRFRTFVLAACSAEGLDVRTYRRLGSSATPNGTPSRTALEVVRGQARKTPQELADAQLRRELATYESALESALAGGQFDVVDQLSNRLERLREEMRGDGG